MVSQWPAIITLAPLLFLLQSCAGLTLKSWLRSLSVHIPQTTLSSLPLPLGYRATLAINDGICTKLAASSVQGNASLAPESETHVLAGSPLIRRLRDASRVSQGTEHAVGTSSENADEDHKAVRLSVNITGVGMSCRILANVSLNRRSETPEGELWRTTGLVVLSFDIEDSSVSSALWVYEAKTPSIPLPVRAVLDACSSSVIFKRLSFSAGASGSAVDKELASLLNRLRPLLVNARFLNEAVCSAASELVNDPVSSMIRSAATALRDGPLLARQPLKEPKLLHVATNWQKLLRTSVAGHVILSFLAHKLHVGQPALFQNILGEVAQLLFPQVPPQIADAKLDASVQVPWLGHLNVEAPLPQCNGSLDYVSNNVTPHVMGGAVGAQEVQCRLRFNVSFAPNATLLDGGVLNVSAGVGASAKSLGVAAALLVGIDGKRALRDYQIDQLQRVRCLMDVLDPVQPMPFRFLDFWAKAVSVSFRPSAIGDELAYGVFAAVGAWSTSMAAAFQPLISMLLRGRAMDSLRDSVNAFMLRTVQRTPPCMPTNFTTGLDETTVVTSYSLAAASGIASALTGAAACLWYCRRVRHKVMMRERLGSVSAQTGVPSTRQAFSTPGATATIVVGTAQTDMPAKPLCLCVLPWTSWTVTSLTLCNLALFAISLTDWQVNLQVVVQDTGSVEQPWARSARMGRIIDFTMWKVLVSFWESRCYLLLLFVILWSCLWPIAKLILMLVCWHFPASVADRKVRGRVLLFLAQIGKLSLFDPFLFIVFLTGFRLRWEDASAVGGGTATLIIEAAPHTGFYMLFLGTVLSLAIGEFMLATHKNEGNAARSGVSDGGCGTTDASNDAISAALCKALAASDGFRSKAVYCACWLLTTLTLPVVVMAISVDAFAFHWGGVVGALKLVLDQPLDTSLSVWNVAMGIPRPADSSFATSIATGFMVLCFVWFVIIGPVLQSIVLLFAWTAPLTPRTRHRCASLHRVLQAWSALDVFAAALLVSVVGGNNFGIASFVTLIVQKGTLQPVCSSLERYLDVACVVFHMSSLKGFAVLIGVVLAQFCCGRLIQRHLACTSPA